MSTLKNLNDVLVEEVKDLYNAENQLLKALPKMAKAASDPALVAGFEKHLEETKVHIERLEQAAEILGISPKGKTCKAMKGLIAEGEEKLDQTDTSAKDAALICAAQKVEHYEIAGYGTIRAFAALLDQPKLEKLFDQTLEEESRTDEKLTEIAKSINSDAAVGV